MTRIDTAREAADRAREAAVQYAGEARTWIAPHLETAVEQARHAARTTVDEHLAPRWEQARVHVPPTVGEAVSRTREAASAAACTAGRAAGPIAQEAQLRGGAALAALRSRVTAEEIERLARRAARRQRRARRLRRVALVAALGGAGGLALAWWRRSSGPEWLVEPERGEGGPDRPTTMADEIAPDGVAGTAGTGAAAGAAGATGATAMPLDPEVQAKSEEEPEE